MSKSEDQPVDESKLGVLIEQLGPLNNRWRDAPPPEKVTTLWRMGDLLLRGMSRPSDALLWQIQDRSYITRNLLRYALIIRRSWSSREELEQLTQELKNYTVFREALPFLKGDREGVDNATYGQVVALLSGKDSQEALRFLKQLKARQIGRQHKKGASVRSVRELADAFAEAFERLEQEAKSNADVRPDASDEALIALSRMAMNLAAGETPGGETSALTVEGPFKVMAGALQGAARGGRAAATAFSKTVGAERLMRAADLFNSLRDGQALAEWRRRHGAR
jgi:hypothetical protein